MNSLTSKIQQILGNGAVASKQQILTTALTLAEAIIGNSTVTEGDALVSSTANALLFTNSSNEITTSSNLIYDSINGYIGINEATPTSQLHIVGKGNTDATSPLLITNSDGTNIISITDDIVTTIGNQLEIIRTNVVAQKIEVNANFGTIAAGIRAGGNSKDFILSSKDGRHIYLSTDFSSNITQVQFALKHNKGVLIADNASVTMSSVAKLQVDSTTKGILVPRMTTTQKNAISAEEGLVVGDITTNKLCYYDGTTWQDCF